MKRSVILAIGLVLALSIALGWYRSSQLYNPPFGTKANPRRIQVTVKEKHITSPQIPITTKKGEVVTLIIASDETEDFHIEGYHAFTNIFPDRTTVLLVETLTAGKFPMFLDKQRAFLGHLEVIP